jgi:Acetyltransferases
MNITYKNTIAADEVNAIRKSMGWRQNDPEQIQSGLDKDELIISAYDKNMAVGVITSRNDGMTGPWIIPEYQFQGIEIELITRIFNFLRSKLKPGQGISIGVSAWNEKQIVLYESLGFQISTPELRGIPMHVCLTNQIELTDKMFKQMDYKED